MEMVRRTVVCALIGMMLVPALSRSDDAGELSKTILDSVAEHLPRGVPSLTQSELKDVMWVTRVIPTATYYPLNPREAKPAIDKSIANAASVSGATAWSLAQAGVSTMLDAIGHGARLLSPADAKGTAREQLASPWISARQIGSLRLISLARLEAPHGSGCNDLINEPTTDVYDSVVLDLRGNEGGLLTAVPTIASHFLDPHQPLFRVLMKNGEAEDFETLRCGPAASKMPLAILIDERTDSGAILLAAVLQDHHRATVIGQLKATLNGSISTFYISPSGALTIIVPTGELVLSGNRRLSDGIRVDIAVPTHDEEALLTAVRSSLDRM